MNHAGSGPAPAAALDCGGRRLALDTPRVMGIVNVTPDSFSDGGQLFAGGRVGVDRALQRARNMVAAGASIIDVGGESTRPGAPGVSVDEELERVIPVIEAIRAELNTIISVDTSAAEVIRAAAAAGAGLINDIRSLQQPGALEAARDSGLPVCLMHMQGDPRTMQSEPHYVDVVAEVRDWLLTRAAACREAGIEAGRIVLDPGFGFGKTVQHNLGLLRHLGVLADSGYPLLVGLSRKSMIDRLPGRPVDQRLPASLALAVMAVQNGAAIVRVHDVAETVDALAMVAAVQSCDQH